MAMNAQFLMLVFAIGCIIVSCIALWIWMQGPEFKRRREEEWPTHGDVPNVPKHSRWPRGRD